MLSSWKMIGNHSGLQPFCKHCAIHRMRPAAYHKALSVEPVASLISGPIGHANTVKSASNCGSAQLVELLLRIGRLVDLHGLALPHNMYWRDDIVRFFYIFSS